MTAPRILVAGEINADLVLRGFSSWPALGREVLVEGSELVLGSASAICASGLARLGNAVVFAGRVGDDLMGRFCRDLMASSGIELDYILVDRETATGITVSLTTGGDRALVTCLGAIAAFSAEDVPDEALEGIAHLHVSGFYLQPALRPGLPDLFRRARRRGITTSLDTGHDPREEWGSGLEETLQETDLFFPNEVELRATRGREDLKEALGSLGSALVVAKLGSTGAACLDGSSLLRAEAPEVDVVDTTGAGDSFNAGFLHAWLRRKPLETCLRYGVTAGSLSTRALGGTKAQPTLAELEAFLLTTDH